MDWVGTNPQGLKQINCAFVVCALGAFGGYGLSKATASSNDNKFKET